MAVLAAIARKSPFALSWSFMLDAMRKRASTWVVRALLVVLIASFAIWGIGDVFRAPGPSDVVARVGELPVTVGTVRRDAELGFAQLQRQVGPSLVREPAVMNALTQQALQSLIARRLVDAHVDDLGLTVAEATLAREVREEAGFQGLDGFDRARFDMFLRSTGVGEAQYLAELRADLLRDDLVGAVIGAAAPSETLARRLDGFRGERRTGEVLVVEGAGIAVPPPDDAALQAYVDANPELFRAAEARAVDVVALTPDQLADEVEVTEAQLRQAYDAEIARFSTPERRRAVQLVAAEEAALRRAAQRVAQGAGFAAVAEALKSEGVTRVELGPVTRGELPETLDAAIFTQAPGVIGEPVRSPLGWHLLEVVEVTAGRTVPFEPARAGLEREMKHKIASERIADVGTRLDDALAAGTPLADAARQVGASFTVVPAVDPRGFDPAGKPATEPPLPAAVLREIQGQNVGDTSLLLPAGDGYYVVATRGVTPARVRPLGDVREEATTLWRLAEQTARAKTQAAKLLEQAKSGATLAALAQSGPGLRLQTLGPVERAAPVSAKTLGPAAHAALFATAAGGLATEPVEVPGGAALVATREITPADPARPIGQLTTELARAVQNDLATSYERALRGRYRVELDQRALAGMLGDTGR